MKQAIAARVLALTFACLLSMTSLELLQGVQARPARAGPASRRQSPLLSSDDQESRVVKLKAFKSMASSGSSAAGAAAAAMTASRMNMAEARKYGLLEHRLAVCPLPDFVAENTDLFNPRTEEVNIRDVIKYWKLLHKQMKLRYGSDELEMALAGQPSRVRFDEVDQVFFELREYILCLASESSVNDSN